MDFEEFDSEHFTAAQFKISESRWVGLLEMLAENKYIDGVKVSRSATGESFLQFSNVRITLGGLEYLQENSFMKKAMATAKGITDLIP